MTISLSGLFVYPIKSCRGIALEEAELDSRGIRHDREWMVVDTRGKFITQRTHERLALVRTAFTSDGAGLLLDAPGLSQMLIPLEQKPGTPVRVEVWGDSCQAVDAGEAAASWFSELLGTSCRLVRMAPDWVRPVRAGYDQPGISVGFADAYPLLGISEATLADLGERLGESLPMDRFRPNLVFSGAAVGAEDGWQSLRIGEVELKGATLCTRCKITTIDQATATPQGAEPLRTLGLYRPRLGGTVTFGRNLVHLAPGRLHVGAPVEV